MHVTRFDQAPEYSAPGHIGMRCLRMLGREAGPAEFAWLGISIIDPGGCIEPASSTFEKLYLVLEGELEFTNTESKLVLGKWDACRFAPNEERMITNLSDRPAAIMLAMSNIRL